MTRRQGTNSEKTKRSLIEAATHEFAEYGYAKASLRRICSNCDLTTGALYFFFDNKEDLFRSVIEPVTSEIVAITERHFATESERMKKNLGSNRANDLAAAGEFLDAFYDNAEVGLIILSNRDCPLITRFFDLLIKLMATQIRRFAGSVYGTIPPESAMNEHTILWFAYSQLNIAIHVLSHSLTREEAERQLHIMTRVLRKGLLTVIDIDAENGLISNTGENAAYLRLVRDHLSGPRLGLKNP